MRQLHSKDGAHSSCTLYSSGYCWVGAAASCPAQHWMGGSQILSEQALCSTRTAVLIGLELPTWMFTMCCCLSAVVLILCLVSQRCVRYTLYARSRLAVNGAPYQPFSDTAKTGNFSKLFSFGARSFTIWKLKQGRHHKVCCLSNCWAANSLNSHCVGVGHTAVQATVVDG